MLSVFTCIKEKRTASSLRGSMTSEHTKKIHHEEHVLTPTEADESKDMMDQERLEEDLGVARSNLS